jgi:hypothetical protein
MTIEMTERGSVAASAAPGSTPREVAAYLKATRVLVNAANESRAPWIRQLGVLMRSEDDEAHLEAGRVGLGQRDTFVRLRARLAVLPIPAACATCHDSLTNWLEKHVAACDAMVEAGDFRDLGRLRVAQGLLAEARGDLGRFNAAFEGLVAVLQARANARHRQRRPRVLPRWPFGRRSA